MLHPKKVGTLPVEGSDEEKQTNEIKMAAPMLDAMAIEGRTITADTGAVTIEDSGGLELDTGSMLQTPGNPVLAGSVFVGGSPFSVYVSGRYAYVIDFSAGDLNVVDHGG